ncbi:MAG TPA: diacylglycerol kinase family protein [Pseudonocardiaceae bacterium]|nr:diacylglycerol kinase family protein [Pseudonocardiaceae bacterium]
MTTHAALLVHPGAARVAGSVAACLRTGVDRLDTFVADSAAGSRALAARAVNSGAEALITLGGDGLAHLAVQACAGTGTALAVVPAGTGNDLAHALGLPADPLLAARVVADALRANESSKLDLGRIAGGAWFSTVLCAGFDAAVNARANRLRWPRGPRRYELAIMIELARLRPAPLVVEADDTTLRLDATLVAVGNTRYYGGGVPVCPDAMADDGWLDLTVVAAASRLDLLRMLPTLRTGAHTRHPAVTTLRARSIRLSGQGGWFCYADGDRQARLPVTITCVPEALRVISRKN